MICPVCKRDLAPTLSICLTCGAMMNDTVREELACKVVSTGEIVSGELKKITPQISAPALPAPSPMAAAKVDPPLLELPTIKSPPIPKLDPKPIAANPAPRAAPPEVVKVRENKVNTANLAAKQTNPTLVEFQTKNATLPDWRLQLQNSVRQRNSAAPRQETNATSTTPIYQKQLVTSGANALKSEYVEQPLPVVPENSKVASALKRIEESRRAFSPEPKKTSEAISKAAANRNFPFNVVSRSGESTLNRTESNAVVAPAPKPKLVSSLRIEKKAFNTNKLPQLPQPAKISTSFDAQKGDESVYNDSEFEKLWVDLADTENEVPATENSSDAVDDLAPLAMRFNSGLFDLIIGGFSSFILLSPFVLAGSEWMSLTGFLAFAATLAVVMFIYLTVSIGYFGRSFGMRLFSLELVDAEESEYPTMHQAAVSSSVYLLSLALGGIGFLPLFFNEEKRAAHDLVSGTILVKEY